MNTHRIKNSRHIGVILSLEANIFGSKIGTLFHIFYFWLDISWSRHVIQQIQRGGIARILKSFGRKNLLKVKISAIYCLSNQNYCFWCLFVPETTRKAGHVFCSFCSAWLRGNGCCSRLRDRKCYRFLIPKLVFSNWNSFFIQFAEFFVTSLRTLCHHPSISLASGWDKKLTGEVAP